MKKFIIYLLILATAGSMYAQNVTYTSGGSAKYDVYKGADYINFECNGLTYHISQVDVSTLSVYSIYCYDNAGGLKYHKELEFNPGVFNNNYEIMDIIPFNNKVIGLVENLNKDAGKNTLSARVIDESGVISKSETVLNDFPFEKLMNSGFNYYSVSPGGNTLGVAALLPYEKEQSGKIKYAYFDSALKKTKEGTITLPGEDTKNKQLRLSVSDNGIFYLTKQTTEKNGNMVLAVYQWNAGDTKAKEYFVDVTISNRIREYKAVVNPENELILCGTWYENKTLTVGEDVVNGVFCFSNKGLESGATKLSTLDKQIDNLKLLHILLNGNTIFLATEQLKEEQIIANPGSTTVDVNYNFKHGNNYVIALSADGSKKFQIELQKEYAANNINVLYYTAYAIINGKLTIIYNDDPRKYFEGTPSIRVIPVVIRISNDGLMNAPFVIKEGDLKNNYFYLNPSFSTTTGMDKISVLGGDQTNMKPFIFTITD